MLSFYQSIFSTSLLHNSYKPLPQKIWVIFITFSSQLSAMGKNILQPFALLIALFAFSTSASAQIDTSNRGTDFWVGFGHHQFMESGTNTQNMVLYLSAGSQAATVTVTLDSSAATPAVWWKKTYNIPANTAIVSDLIPKGTINASSSGTDPNFDARLFSATSSSGILRGKGIHIESNVPIVAYSHIYGSTSSGATMLVPVHAWGGLYTSVNSKQSYASNCFSWCYVIARYDNTVVEITPSVVTRGQNVTGLQAGVTKTITLMKGQIYQMLGANTGADASGNGGGNSDGYEMTGTRIKSVMSPTGYIHPIAVFSGSSRTTNTAACGAGGGDNDMQQHFPRQAWGRKYLTAPLSSGAGVSGPTTNGYKIAVTDPTTIVLKNGVPLTGLVNNTYYYFESNMAEYIEADKPVLVAQFMTGGACTPGSIGDPEMFYLSPISQAITDVVFYRTTRESISQQFVTLIIPTNGLSSLTIDGSSTVDLTYAHPRLAGYSVVVKRWSPAVISQSVIHSDSAFTGLTYGLGPVESYGYNLGTRLNAVNARDASVLPPGFTGEIPLPVTLLDFLASKKGTDVLLDWKTASEKNFAKFVVERSMNGLEFETIGEEKSKSEILSMYDFTDRKALDIFASNKVLYYRLKMVDNDGRFNYSNIVSIKTRNRDIDISVFPNPFTDHIQIKSFSEIKGKATIHVRDITGRIVLSKTTAIVQGQNLTEVRNLDGLRKGVYIVEIIVNDNRQYFKMVK